MYSPFLEKPELHIAVLTYNALDYTKMCFEKLYQNTGHPFKLWVLDNASADDSPQWLGEFNSQNSNFNLKLSKENHGVPGGRNRLLEMILPDAAENSFIIFLDNDIEVLPGWESIYLQFFNDHPEVGIASARGHTFTVRDGYRLLDPTPEITHQVDVACGGFACWVRKSAAVAIGGFDEKLGIFWHEDDDYTVRALQAGFEAYALPHAPMIHHEHQSGEADPESIKVDGSPENQAYLVEKWKQAGYIDQFGRVRRPAISSEQEASSPKIFESLKTIGVSKNQGGYYLLSPEARLELAANPGGSSKLCFKISAPNHGEHSQEPVQVELITNNRVIQRLEFKNSDQIIQVELNIPSNCQPTTIEIRANTFFSPLLEGCLLTGNHKYALVATDFQMVALDDKVDFAYEQAATPAIKNRASADLRIIGTFFEASHESTINRSLVESFERQGQKIEILPLRQDMYDLQTVRNNPQSLGKWLERTNFSGNAERTLFAGTLDAFLANHQSIIGKDSHYSKHRWDALVYLDRELSQDELKVIKDNSKAYNRIWISTPRCYSGLANLPDNCKTIPTISFSTDHTPTGHLNSDKQATLVIIDWHEDYSLWMQPLHSFLAAYEGSPGQIVVLESGVKTKRLMDPRRLIASLVADTQNSPLEYATQINVVDGQIPLADKQKLFSASKQILIPSSNPDRYSQDIALGLYLERVILLPTEPPKSFNLFLRFFHRPDVQLAGERNQPLTDSERELLYQYSIASFIEEFSRKDSPTEIVETEHEIRNQPTGVRDRKDHYDRHIGIDARTLLFSQNAFRGIGQYTRYHLKKVFELCPDWQFSLCLELNQFNPAIEELLALPNVEYRSFYEDHNKDFDLYHIPDMMSMMSGFDSPFHYVPKGIPCSVIFYDLTPIVLREIHFDKWGEADQVAYLTRINQLQNNNWQLLAISESSARDAENIIKINRQRISTIYAGLNAAVVSNSNPSNIEQTKEKYGITDEFFLTVGGIDPHKNFEATFQAFLALNATHPCQLVVAGSMNDPYKGFYKSCCEENNINNVIFTDFIEREELEALYRGARALVFPSLYEGFGFPALEAMAHGCPVIGSNTSSLPEVIGDAGILVQPDNVQGIAQAMAALLVSETGQQELSKKGLVQSHKFSWKRTANLTIDSWRHLWDVEEPTHSNRVTASSSIRI